MDKAIPTLSKLTCTLILWMNLHRLTKFSPNISDLSRPAEHVYV